jgi:DNA polymerase-3 subunit beta
MKIIVPQSNFIHTLELVSRVSTKHVTLPVLQCVLVTVTDSTITCTATNLEIRLEAQVVGTIVETGTVAIPAQTLLQAVQYATQKNLEISVVDGVLHIDTGRGKTTINIFPAEEFPTATKIEQVGAVIQRDMFSLGIKSVAFAASVSSIKPELGSVYIQQKKEQTLTFVATDSFRLMEKTVSQKGFVLEQGILLPQKNAIEIARICDSLSSNPTLSLTENLCALKFEEEGVYVTSRLVSGSFPDYEQIIPKEYSTHTTVLKQDLVQIFKKTNIFLNKFRQVTVAVTGTAVTVSSQNGEVGATTDTMTAQTEGQDITLSFNQQYLLDPLSHIQDDSMVLHFAGIGRPLVLGGVSDTTLRYLVMPMNK